MLRGLQLLELLSNFPNGCPLAKLAVELKLLKAVSREFRQDAHHWLILHGRYVCKARKPECWRCAIADLCDYADKTELYEDRRP